MLLEYFINWLSYCVVYEVVRPIYQKNIPSIPYPFVEKARQDDDKKKTRKIIKGFEGTD